MHSQKSWLQKVRFFTTLGALYALSVVFALYAIVGPIRSVQHNRAMASALTHLVQKPYVPRPPKVTVISGQPVRIVIPDSSVDLPVDPGYYDAASGTWTLSGYRAQFAMASTLANNVGGDTFIYGHNNNYVFGALRHNTPAVGATALVYTSNGHVFAYHFQSATSIGPDDVAFLDYSGPSVLTIQTCTGSLNEWRTMYRFTFAGVVQ